MARRFRARGIEVVDSEVAGGPASFGVLPAFDGTLTRTIEPREILPGEKLEDAATTGTPIDAPADAPALDASAPIGPPFESAILMRGVASADLAAYIDEKEFAEAASKLSEERSVEAEFLDQQLVDTSQTLSIEFAASSNVQGATLDTTTGIVTVRFAKGPAYRYGAFTAELMGEWKAAKSAGSWFHQNVRTKPDRHPVIATAAAGEG